MKKLPRKLVWTLGIFLGLILVAVIGLKLFFPAEKVKDLAVQKASEKLGRDISVADVGLSFSGGLGVELQGVEIANPPGMAGEPFLFAENIDLKLQISPLFHGEFQVNRLVVDQPRVRLVQLSTDANNFTFAAESAAGAPGQPAATNTDPAADVAVSFDRLEIHGGTLTYLDESTGQAVDLIGLELTAGLTNPTPGVFQSAGFLQVDSLLVSGEKPLPSLGGSVDYDLNFDSTRHLVKLAKGIFKVNGLPLRLQGNMTTPPDSLRFEGNIQAEGIALAELLAYLPPEQQTLLEPYTMTGSLAVEADLEFVAGRPEPLVYLGTAKVADLHAASRDVEGDLKVRELSLKFRPNHLEIGTAGGTLADQPLEATMTVDGFEDPRIEGKVSGEFDLGLLMPYLPAERKATLAGRCRLNGNFAGRTEAPLEMDYSGQAAFTDVSYLDVSLPDTLHQLNGTMRFDQDSITVEKADARFGAGDLSLTGRLVDHLPYFLPAEKDNRDNLAKPNFTFEARSRRLDVDKLFPAAAPASGSPGTGVPEAAATGPAGSIPDVLAQGTIKADTLIYSRVPFHNVAGKIRLKDRILECYEVSAGVYGGQTSGNVAIDLNDLNDPGFRGDFKASEIEADNFLTRFTTLSRAIYGKAGLSGSFSAQGRDPERIKSTLTMDSVAALTSGKVMTGDFMKSTLGDLAAKAGQSFDKEQALKDLSTLIKVENGRVALDQFKTKLGNWGDLSLGGSYAFSGDLEYKGGLLLSKEQTAALYASGGLVGNVANLLGNKAERLNLPLSVGGTMTSPKMDIDYTELSDNLKSQLEGDLKDEVGNALKGLFGK